MKTLELSKNTSTLNLLKIEEKKMFDTYKNNKSNIDKINHLRKMANIIEQIEKIKNESTKLSRS